MVTRVARTATRRSSPRLTDASICRGRWASTARRSRHRSSCFQPRTTAATRGLSRRRSSASNPAPTLTGWPAPSGIRVHGGRPHSVRRRVGVRRGRRSTPADAFRSATTSTTLAHVRAPWSRRTAEGHGRSRSTSCPGSRATIPRRPRRRAGSILPGHVTFPYTDDPSGLSGWTYAGLAGLPSDFVDDTMGWDYGREARDDPRVFNEGSFFQTDDGVIHMMLRSESGPAVGHREPRRRRDVVGAGDDRLYRRHHAGPTSAGWTTAGSSGSARPTPRNPWARTPAVLALSENGVVFDRHFTVGDEPERPPRTPGRGKRGRYGYPYLHVMDGTAFGAYSVAKEDIAVARFPLADLG